MTLCNNCRNPCCDCNCPGCNCRTVTGPNGQQCCTMCITGVQRTYNAQQQSTQTQQVPGVSQSVYMNQILKQRLEAEQHNRFNQ